MNVFQSTEVPTNHCLGLKLNSHVLGKRNSRESRKNMTVVDMTILSYISVRVWFRLILHSPCYLSKLQPLLQLLRVNLKRLICRL